jgi:hypothetical protein
MHFPARPDDVFDCLGDSNKPFSNLKACLGYCNQLFFQIHAGGYFQCHDSNLFAFFLCEKITLQWLIVYRIKIPVR